MSEPIHARREAKRDAFVDAARHLFFSRGYGATSMSAVAAAVGGSKTTLWVHFPSKEALFAAVVDAAVEPFGASLSEPMDRDLPLADGLRLFGQTMLGIVMSPAIVDLERLVVGEAGRFPELGAMFFERGPKRGKGKLAAWLEAKRAVGEVRADADPAMLARQFSFLCQSNARYHRLMGNSPDDATDMTARDVDDAVTTMMAAWAV